MSIVLKCNNCGKNSESTGVVFNDGPISIELTNYEGKAYKAILNVNMTLKSDYDTVLKMNMARTPEEFDELVNTEIEEPNPHICLACKRELSIKLLQEGFIDENNDWKDSLSVQKLRMTQGGFIEVNDLDEYDEYDDFSDDEYDDLI